MSLRILVPLMFFAAIGGCTSHVDGPIDYTVTGGLSGGGDGAALHIELDGTVTRPKAGGGTETATLDAATLGDLRSKIDAADFESLAPKYSCNCADNFIDNISVQLDGTVHTVAADRDAQLPDGLKTVVDTLLDIYQRPLDWH